MNLLDLLLLLPGINSDEYEKEAKNSNHPFAVYRSDSRALRTNLPLYKASVRRLAVCVCGVDRMYCLFAEVHCREESAKETVRCPKRANVKVRQKGNRTQRHESTEAA